MSADLSPRRLVTTEACPSLRRSSLRHWQSRAQSRHLPERFCYSDRCSDRRKMVPLSLTYSLLMSCDCLLEGADSISFDVDRLSMEILSAPSKRQSQDMR